MTLAIGYAGRRFGLAPGAGGAKLMMNAVGFAGMLGIWLGAWPAAAQDQAMPWKGKPIHMFVGSAPGGGYDTFSRVIAAHLGRHLPGQPTIVVQHMPGAGS